MRVDDGESSEVYWFPAGCGTLRSHTDHPSAALRTGLGSTSLLSTISGTLVMSSTTRFLPFGDYRVEPEAGLTDKGFTGHAHNSYIKLIDMKARWYSGQLGRFLQPDTIVLDPRNPQDLNRYSYVRNTPARYTDPTGHCIMGDVASDLCFQEFTDWPPRVQVVRGGDPGTILLPIWRRMPVQSPTALQWYGNTQWAYENGVGESYDDFAQGLHPGIDLVAAVGEPIYAGTYGTVLVPGGKYAPGRVDIGHGEARLLYGHVANIQVRPGDTVNPDTIIGYIDTAEAHVHFEILRSDEDGVYMTNPLPFLTTSLQVELLDLAELQGDDSRVSFYVPSSGTLQWQSPYDQPDLRREAGWIFPQ